MEERKEQVDITTTAPSEEIKKPRGKVNFAPIAVLLGMLAILAAVAYMFVFFTVTRPESIFAEAKLALENKDFLQCEALLDSIPGHKETAALRKELNFARAECYIENGELEQAEDVLLQYPGEEKGKSLREDIQYIRAEQLLEENKWEEAQLILDQLPEYEDTKQLKEKICYEKAMAAAEKGDYKSAYELFGSLGEYEDAAQQKEIVYYEALVIKALAAVQEDLKNPDSLQLISAVLYKNDSVEGELDLVIRASATNSYGGRVSDYLTDQTLFDDNDDHKWSTEKKSKKFIEGKTEFEVAIDIAHINRVLSAGVTPVIDLPFAAAS